MENKYILQLKEIIIGFFKDDDVKIILFGSRARKDNYIFSDVDIGILPNKRLDTKKIAYMRERLENLNIPYKVEIINFSEVSANFEKQALREAIVWKD